MSTMDGGQWTLDSRDGAVGLSVLIKEMFSSKYMSCFSVIVSIRLVISVGKRH